FFYKVVDAQLHFELDPAGKAVAVVLHQNGRDVRAPRTEGEPVQPKAATLDLKVFDRYAGNYRLGPGAVLTISREGERLFVRLTGQRALEILPSSERDFFLKEVDAQLTFEVDHDGNATACILHQGGLDQRAPREE